MIEKACKDYIKGKLSTIQTLCQDLKTDIGEIDLNDVDFQLNRIRQELDTASSQLNNCEDY